MNKLCPTHRKISNLFDYINSLDQIISKFDTTTLCYI